MKTVQAIIASGGTEDDLCYECQRAFNKGQAYLSMTDDPAELSKHFHADCLKRYKMNQQPTNIMRAGRIQSALDAQDYTLGSTRAEAVTDALSDLRHFCDRYNLDFGALDKLAYQHYLEEK